MARRQIAKLIERSFAAATGWLPRMLVVLHDLAMVWSCWIGLDVLRFRMQPGHVEVLLFSPTVAFVVIAQGSLFGWMGLYRGLWRFASLPDMVNIAKAAVLGLLLIVLGLFIANRLEMVPRSVLVLYPVVLVALVGGPRLLYRAWKDGRRAYDASHPASRVLIVGAGHSGEELVRRMLRDSSYQPVGFLDDNRRLNGLKVQGIPVLGTLDVLVDIARETGADLVAIAIQNASAAQMRRVVELCDEAGVPFRRVPKLSELLEGRMVSDQLKEVVIEDLLGRDPVPPDWMAMRRWIDGRSVLVTGAGGSIGSELCRQIAELGASSLTLVEQSELALIAIRDDLHRRAPSLVVHCVLGDCGDRAVIDHALRLGQAQAVLHAAAYKHVPVLEGQVREAVRNNGLATHVVAEASAAFGAHTFVLISTDKAVDPANVLGASKRLAEMACQAVAAGGTKTRMTIVRFGNVLDSAGSVVPIFREQIRQGGPVTVTHPDVTRYFMTIPEACQLILQAVAIDGDQGIFILDMGEPVPIKVLAEQMIRLSGKVPGRDMQIVYTGLRVGEKMHERLYHADEDNRRTAYPKILQARSREVDAQALARTLSTLRDAVERYDEGRLHRLLREAIPEYLPAQGAVVVPLPLGRRSMAS